MFHLVYLDSLGFIVFHTLFKKVPENYCTVIISLFFTLSMCNFFILIQFPLSRTFSFEFFFLQSHVLLCSVIIVIFCYSIGLKVSVFLLCNRYWVTEMHVDGFRFDLASIMTRGSRLFAFHVNLFRELIFIFCPPLCSFNLFIFFL